MPIAVCPKKGEGSVGVAPQDASSPGKTANCQALVPVALASNEVPAMAGLRLFRPEAWMGDPDRMARARVPKDRQLALSKPEIAIAKIDPCGLRASAWAVCWPMRVTDRAGLSARA